MTHREKAVLLFREAIGSRAERLAGTVSLEDSIGRIAMALQEERGESSDLLRSDDIGFHLMDWQSDAAFLVAVALYPDRFTSEEIQEGVRGFLIHAPAHVLEAARLSGIEARNIFHKDA